jgi:alkylation response protein AidB-like acyl-CoA dehydrogenase
MHESFAGHCEVAQRLAERLGLPSSLILCLGQLYERWDGKGIPLALAGSHAIEAACQAVDLVHSCAGTSGIRNERRFQQYFRDVHTISQHAFVSHSRFESTGKLMLGRESDWPFYYL